MTAVRVDAKVRMDLFGNTKGVMTYRDTSTDHRKVWQWKICQHEKMCG